MDNKGNVFFEYVQFVMRPFGLFALVSNCNCGKHAIC